MNKDRRKAIAAIHGKLDELKGLVAILKDEIDTLKGEEEEYYDNMPVNMQSGDKGTAAEAAKDALEEAADKVEDAVSALDDALTSLDTAAE